MVEKIDRKCWNVFEFPEHWDIDVLAASDIEKNTVNEEQKCLYVQMLTPTKTEIKEKLC